MNNIVENINSIIAEIQKEPLKSQPILNAVKLLSVASDILKSEELFAPIKDMDVTPLINNDGVSKPNISVTSDIGEVFSVNPYKNDPNPFVLCKPELGFSAIVKRAGTTEKVPLVLGEPIRNGDELWLISENDITSGNVYCCGLYYPYGVLGGELLNFTKPFAVNGRKETGFIFTLSGTGKNTIVDNFISAYQY
jgi:hypothetical protein